MADRQQAPAFRIAAIYFVVASISVATSELLLDVEHPSLEIALHALIVGMTALVLYLLARHYFRIARVQADRQSEMEHQLRHNRDQLAAAQRIAHLGSWEADLGTSRLVWSDEVYRIFGVARRDFPNTVDAFAAFVHPDDIAGLGSAQEWSRATGKPLAFEHRIIRPDGEVRYVLERAEIETDEAGRQIRQIGTVQDITSRKLAELELQNRNRQQTIVARLGLEALKAPRTGELLQQTMEAAADALGVEYAGLLKLHPDGRQLRLVAGAGYPPGSIGNVSVPVHDHSHAGFTLERDEPVVIRDLRTETRFQAPGMQMYNAVSGLTAVVHGGSEPWGLVGVYSTTARDFDDADVALVQTLANLIGAIQQRQQASDAVYERNILRQLASEAASLGGWAYQPGTQALSWSQEARNIHEVSDDFAPDVPAAVAFYAPEHRDRIRRRFEACLKEGTPYDEEVQLVTARGRRIWVRAVGRAEIDAGGHIFRVHGAIQDISERKSLESMLHQSQRMEAIGQLTGGVAHDFNNLLTVILGNADELLRMAGEDEPLRTMAETTYQAARRGADLTSRLLAYARKQPLAPQPTDIERLLTAMDQLLRRTLGEQIEIKIVHGPGLWTAMVDAAQLESALLNLCLNARDAMPQGGKLTLETANVELDEAYARQNHEVAPGQFVRILVRDTGCGLSRELADRVFEPFFTTKPSGQGSGLGLSMVYGFVKQSRGHVRLESEPAQGTTVKLYLPRTRSEAELPPRPLRGGTHRGHGERILVVEDDDLVRRFVAEQVESLGYRVLTAASGVQALGLLAQFADVALLFTDVVMPGEIDGRRLAQEARQRRPDLPVLFTSGYAENAIVHEGRLEPGIDLLNKPYRLAELAMKLRSALQAGPLAAADPAEI